MPEENAPEAGTAPAAAAAKPSADLSGRAKERVEEATREAAEAKRERDEMKARLDAIEAENLSEKERAEKERDEARAEADKANAKVTRMERSQWARDAAQAAGFIDAGDAVAHLDLDTLDTETKVTNAVTKLAEAKTHLVSQRPQGGFGTPAPRAPEAGIPTPGVQGGEDEREAHERGLGQDLLANLTGRVGR